MVKADELRRGAWLTRSVTLSTADYFSRGSFARRRINSPKLFVHYFDLLVDHLPAKSIDGHVDPVMPLAFNNEIVCHDTNVLAPFSCWLTSISQLLLQVACQARPHYWSVFRPG